MPTLAFVGLDVSQNDVSICFLLPDSAEPVPAGVSQHPARCGDLGNHAAALAQTHHIDQLHIGIGVPRVLWWHLACHLKDAPTLALFAPRLYALNPHLIKTFRANYRALPKCDHTDAFLIAERICFGRQVPPYSSSTPATPIQRLTRFRCHLAQNLAREKSYFLSFLFLTFSTYGQIAPLGDPFGATSSGAF